MDNEEQYIEGINFLISITNANGLDLILDFNKPNDEACKVFANILYFFETGKIYENIVKKMQVIYKQGNPDEINAIEKIQSYKKLFDFNLGAPAVLPREVFHKGERTGV